MSSIFFWRKKREEETTSKAEGNTQSLEQAGSDENLTPATLPVRSSKRGIRSLFATAKFDSSDLQSLEEILLQADFGLAASEKIVAEVKQHAS
jgi:fused signal recognition particle receptor